MKFKNMPKTKRKTSTKATWKHSNKKGLTLVEIIIYIAIHVVLVTQVLGAIFQSEKVWGMAEGSLRNYVYSLPVLKAPQSGFISLSFVIVVGFVTLTLSFIHAKVMHTYAENILLHNTRKEIYIHEEACEKWVQAVYGLEANFSRQSCHSMAKERSVYGGLEEIDKYFR